MNGTAASEKVPSDVERARRIGPDGALTLAIPGGAAEALRRGAAAFDEPVSSDVTPNRGPRSARHRSHDRVRRGATRNAPVSTWPVVTNRSGTTAVPGR